MSPLSRVTETLLAALGPEHVLTDRQRLRTYECDGLAQYKVVPGLVVLARDADDVATAEISRSQVWQWLHNDVTLADTGHRVTRELVERIADEEIAKLPGDPADYEEARQTFLEVAVADDYADFLTLPAYQRMS